VANDSSNGIDLLLNLGYLSLTALLKVKLTVLRSMKEMLMAKMMLMTLQTPWPKLCETHSGKHDARRGGGGMLTQTRMVTRET
jgi:hypothetical protein